jgi:hypothetical protein
MHTYAFWKILKEGGYFEDLGMDGMVTLDGLDQLKTYIWSVRLNSFGCM